MGTRAFSNLLETADLDGLRTYWRESAPHLPQPKTRLEAEIAIPLAGLSETYPLQEAA